jgi:hypothetical protein
MKDFNGFRKLIVSNQLKQYGHTWKETSSKTSKKADQLVDGIISGRFSTDSEAAYALYNKGPDCKSYQMLKSRVKEQFINLVLSADQTILLTPGTYSYSYSLVHRYYYAAYSMVRLGWLSEGHELLRSCLNLAKKHQITNIIINSSRLLKSHAGYNGTALDYQMYKDNIKKYISLYKAEIESDDMRDELHILMRQSISPHDKKKLTRYWKRVCILNKKYESHILRINRTVIGYFYHEVNADNRGIIRICNQMIDYMLKFPAFYERSRHRLFQLYKVDAYTRLEDFNKAEKSAIDAIKLHSDYSPNSISVFEYYIHLCLNSCKYSKAFDLYEKATGLQLYNNFPDERKEKWKLFEAYLSFVYPESGLKVKPAGLFSEMPVFSKDKGGSSITIVIAQIIILLDEGNFDKLLDRSDAFKIYFKRYVNRQIHYRTFLFTKMIETLFRCNFNYGKVEEAAKEFRLHLRDKKGFYKGRIEALEIIPYEVLWEQILLRLKKYETDFVKMQGIKMKRTLKNQKLFNL